MKLIGILACILGVALLLMGVSAETTAPYADTLNIGLMQRQVLLVNSGLAALLSGVMLIGFSAVVEAIKPESQAVVTEPTPLSEDDEAFRRRFQIGGALIVALIVVLVVFAASRDRTPDYNGVSGEYNTMDTMGTVDMNTMGTTMGINTM